MSYTLNGELKRLRKRVRFLLAERYGLLGACAGTLVAAVLAVLSLKYDSLIDYRLWAGGIALGVALGIAGGLLRRLDDLAVAMAVDKRAGLKERLSTAVVVSGHPCPETPNDTQHAVISDAIAHASPLRPREVFPHRFGLPHGAFGIAALLLIAAILVPQMPALQSKTRRQEIVVMKQEGVKLEKIAKDIHRQTSSKQDELRKLANRLDALGKKMQTGRMTRKAAMLKTRKLSKEVKEQQDILAKQNSASKPMSLAQSEMQKASEELAQKMAQEIAKHEGIPLSEAMKKLPSDKRLAELARKEGPLTESERKELEKLVSKYANPNSGMPIPSELAEALTKLAQNEDYKKASEIMRKLAQKLNSGNMSKQDQEALKKQMEALSKALKNTDLDQLAKAMRENAEKLANMSEEDLKKLMQQIEEMQKRQKMLAKAGGG